MLWTMRWKRMGDALMDRLRQDVPFGPEHELASIALLAATICRLLTHYGTTIEQDEQLLAALRPSNDPSLSLKQRLDESVQRSALHLRLGEKRILQAHVALLARYKDILKQQIANAQAAEEAEQDEL
jgi:hypothetical protein